MSFPPDIFPPDPGAGRRSAPDPATARARQLAARFRDALAAGIHPAACLCGGRFRPSIDATGLELDMLEYLQPRYQSAGAGTLAALVQARRAALETEPSPPRFGAWLTGLSLAEPDRITLLDDLEGLIASIAAATPGGGLICT